VVIYLTLARVNYPSFSANPVAAALITGNFVRTTTSTGGEEEEFGR
jgi:hypothetical protein